MMLMTAQFLPWDQMTPAQREYTIYTYAWLYMSEVLSWPHCPPEIGRRLKELGDVWGSEVDQEGGDAHAER